MNALLEEFLGLNADVNDLTWMQIMTRTVVVFAVGIALFRLADRRFLGRSAGFDVLLAFILGSVLSRGINGQAPFLESLGASALLIVLHRIAGSIACRWSPFSKLLKGNAVVLVRDGRKLEDAMHRSDISNDDLEENLRINAHTPHVSEIEEARLERSGQISAIKKRNVRD
jgi:uncharacterized membrane protein YcaP (DUF421 family)